MPSIVRLRIVVCLTLLLLGFSVPAGELLIWTLKTAGIV